LEGKEHCSRAEACRYAKINERAMTDWAKGTIPAADTLYAIAEFLGTSVEYLLTGKDKEGFSHNERALVHDYKALSDDNKRNVRALIYSMLAVQAHGEKTTGQAAS
jgi:transcriptional regulator with XRE-family HTH domain